MNWSPTAKGVTPAVTVKVMLLIVYGTPTVPTGLAIGVVLRATLKVVGLVIVIVSPIGTAELVAVMLLTVPSPTLAGAVYNNLGLKP